MTARQIEAAALVAEDRLTNDKIAKKVGIAIRTLLTWKLREDFDAEVKRQTEVIAKAASASLYADKKFRMSKLEELARKWERVFQEQGASSEMKDIPGGKTGLIMRRVRTYKSGSEVKFIAEYERDAASSAEYRAVMEQIAVEVGDWKHKHELTGPNGQALVPKSPLPAVILEAIRKGQQQQPEEPKGN